MDYFEQMRCIHCDSTKLCTIQLTLGEYICIDCKAVGSILIPIPENDPDESEAVSMFEKLTSVALASVRENGYTEHMRILSKELIDVQEQKRMMRESEHSAIRENIKRFGCLWRWQRENMQELLDWGEKLYKRLLFYANDQDPDILLIKYELAFCYNQNHQIDRAVEIGEELLSMKEWTFGGDRDSILLLLASIYILIRKSTQGRLYYTNNSRIFPVFPDTAMI